MTFTAVVTILYLVVVFAAGYLATRRKGGAEEFFVAGRQLPWMLLLPFLAAEYISGGSTVGIAEKVHKTGVSGLVYYAASPLGLVMLAFGFAKFFQKIKKITVGETVAYLFDHKTRLAAVITIMVIYPLSVCTAPLGLATAIAPVFGLSYDVAVWVSAAFLVVLAITGLRGQAWMNVIHFVAIMVCFIPLGIAATNRVGGLGNMLASVPSGHLNPAADGVGTMTAWITSSILIKLIALSAITAMFAAKSETDAKIGAVGTGVFLLAFIILPGLIGLAAYIVAPGIESKQALWVMSEKLGTWGPALASIGVLAAIISTTPASLLGLGTLATRDVFMLCRPKCSDSSQLLFCRLAICFFGFAGTALAIWMTKGSTILAISFKSVGVRTIVTIPLLVSILWRRIHPAAAFWTIVLGGLSGVIWTFSGSPFGVEPMWPALAVGIVTMVVVSLVKKPSTFKAAEGLEVETEGR